MMHIGNRPPTNLSFRPIIIYSSIPTGHLLISATPITTSPGRKCAFGTMMFWDLHINSTMGATSRLICCKHRYPDMCIPKRSKPAFKLDKILLKISKNIFWSSKNPLSKMGPSYKIARSPGCIP